MIKEVVYKEKYELYNNDYSELLGIFGSRREALEYNHGLQLQRIARVKAIESHNARYKEALSLYSTK